MKALTQFTFAALLALLTFASCKKEIAEPQPQFDQTEVNNDLNEIMEDMELASQAIRSAQAQNKLEHPDCIDILDFPDCALVTIEEMARPFNATPDQH